MPDANDSRVLRIAVLSDLHAYDGDMPNPPSYLKVSHPESDTKQNPMGGLFALIAKEGLKADLLVCPGDITNQSHETGLTMAWKYLHELRQKLDAELLVTPGNHDLDSRYLTNQNDPDPKGFLTSLSPPFPLDDEALNNHFWARNFVLLERDWGRAVLLNSCAYHGGKQEEIDHGRISQRTLDALERTLDDSVGHEFNVLVCHHHPLQHDELNLGDRDLMKNGSSLLRLLGCGKYGEWLVIHGHKHHPKVSYAAGSSAAPIVFAAGSFSATLWSGIAGSARNLFYLLEVPLDAQALGLRGRASSWDWTPGLGWGVSSRASGLPGHWGFGPRAQIASLASSIAGFLKSVEGGAAVPWRTIGERFPAVDHLIPVDLDALFSTLERMEVGAEFTEGGTPSSVGVRPVINFRK